MDPISALAFACNILQLVETSIDVASSCQQIYQRGSLSENDNIEQSAVDLSSANKALVDELATVRLSARDARIRSLAVESNKTADELTTILRQLKFATKQGKGKSLLLSIRTIAKRHPIEKLQQKLEKQDSLLTSTILKQLYVRCGQHEILQAEGFKTLNQGQQNLIQRHVELQGQINQSHVALLSQGQATEQRLIQGFETLKAESRADRMRDNLLQSLYFPEMVNRQNMIQQRIGEYGYTYEWVFNRDRSQTRQSDFVEWLRDEGETGLFWITGKPGSGKSSLMNFIHHTLREDSQHQYLQLRPNTRYCLVVGHFFFKAGESRLQSSFEGLLRTVCYYILDRTREAVDLFELASKLPTFLRPHLLESTHNSTWLHADLKVLCKSLLELALPSTSTVLLVDGLDEIETSQEDVFSFLEMINAISENLRVCCSSRPELLFRESFQHCKFLRVHEHNACDMREVCTRELENTRAASLCEEVVVRAEGIFLWLHIVVSDLRRAAAYESEQELRDRLNSCPSEIYALFGHMLDRIDSQHQRRPLLFLQYFLLYSSDCMSTDLTTLSLILVTMSDDALQNLTHNHLSSDIIRDLSARCSTAQEQIMAHCGGIVEIHRSEVPMDSYCSPTDDVWPISRASSIKWRFVHRTASDFLHDLFRTGDKAHLFPHSKMEMRVKVLSTRLAEIAILRIVVPRFFAVKSSSRLAYERFFWSYLLTRRCIHNVVVSLLADGFDESFCFEFLDKYVLLLSNSFGANGTISRARLHRVLRSCSLRITLSKGASAGSQIRMLAAEQPKLLPYVRDRIRRAPADEQPHLAALAALTILTSPGSFYDDTRYYRPFQLWQVYFEEFAPITHTVRFVERIDYLPVARFHVYLFMQKCPFWHIIMLEILSNYTILKSPTILVDDTILNTLANHGISGNARIPFSLLLSRYPARSNEIPPWFNSTRPFGCLYSPICAIDAKDDNFVDGLCVIEGACDIFSVTDFLRSFENDEKPILETHIRISTTRVSPTGTKKFFVPLDDESHALSRDIMDRIARPGLRWSRESHAGDLFWHVKQKEILQRNGREFNEQEKDFINQCWDRFGPVFETLPTLSDLEIGAEDLAENGQIV